MQNARFEMLNYLLIAFVVYLLPSSTDGSTCTSPAIETYSDLGILCYWVHDVKQPASNASESCELEGGHLAEIPDTTVLSTLVSSLPVNYPGLAAGETLHLGYVQKSVNATEARRPPYNVPRVTQWAASEPSYNAMSDNCVTMDNSNGDWFVGLCSDTRSALCFNITVVSCTLNTTEFALLHMSASLDVIDLSTNVTFTCDEGHAFHVNHTSQEVVTNMTLHCVYSNGTVALEPHGNEYNKRCDIVTCPLLTPVDKSFTDLVVDRSYRYGETFTVNCTAGYLLSIEHLQWPPQLTTVCTDTGQWSVTPPQQCKKSKSYVGCYAAGALQTITNTSLTGQLHCTTECQTLDFRYAASANSSCFCGNYIDPAASRVDDMQCNMSCPLIPLDTHFAYCGGENNQESIYQTLPSGCYKELDLTGNSTLLVTGNMDLTCQQRCLTVNAFYAILSENQCVCTNTSNLQGRMVTTSKCDTVEASNYNGTLYDLENMVDLTPEYESCEKLYEAGVKDNADYNLKTLGTTYCSFKDGTICPFGWIGYANDCYLFTKGNLTFVDAVQYCQQWNATVASLLTSGQNAFAASTISGFEEYQGSTTLSKKWLIGLVDPKSLTAYSWMDGNLLTEQQFAQTEPVDEILNCVVLFETDGKWYSHSCEEATNAICKQSGERVVCVHEGTGLDNIVWNTTREDMTLTICMQACIARDAAFSLARNETCFCVEDLPSAVTSFSHCDSGCPANRQQMCGGTESGYYTAVNLLNTTKATTCEDLQSQGLTGDLFKLNGSENASFCESTGCPYAWIKGNSSCYKIMLGKKRFPDAMAYCANYSSHLLVLETEEEDAFILEVIGNLTFFSSTTVWTFGLEMTGDYTNRFFWANGQRNNPMIKNTTGTDKLKRGYFKSPIGDWKLGGSTNERSYICEQSEVYSGCYLRSNNSVAVITYEPDLSVQQCVESCRGLGHDYAMLQGTRCLCDETLPIYKYDVGCSDICSNIQPCGSMSNDAVSVYNTWLYPPSDTCAALYDQGIIRSGMYLLDGANITCNFYDNTTCPTTDWIGYRNKCYIFIDDKLSQDDLSTHCALLEGHLLTVNDESEHNFLRMVLKGHKKYAHTYIRLGLVDEFGMGITTWVTGALPSYFPRPSPSSPLTSVVMELSSTLDYGYSMTDAATNTYGFCELQTHHMGCFGVPGVIQPIISKYGNMELTQCKQICMGDVSLDGFALIQRASCYCTESLIGLSPANGSSCQVTCPGNSLQVCGGDDVINAYKLEPTDVASNCSNLYKAGVWRMGSYRIGNSTQECGNYFFDDTECPTSWYGRNGTCYTFASLVGMTYAAAETTCFNNGGYLFYPGSYDARQLFMAVLPYISTTTDGFWTSVKDDLLNSYTRAGDGWIITNGSVVDENIYTVFNMTTGSLNKHSNGTFAVICERSAGYVGCKHHDTMSTPMWDPYARDDMSATQCIQYCLISSEAVYSTIQNKQCSCYNETAVFVASDTSCEACLGYSAQPCGSSTSMSVFRLSHYVSNLASSCAQLFDLGFWMIGQFLIQPKDNDPILMMCFAEVYTIIMVQENLMTASSFKPPHLPALLRGTQLQAVMSPDSAWIPADSDSSPWVQMDLTSDYLVTGMMTQGRADPSTEQWSTALQIRYQSTVDSSWKSIGSFIGNMDRTSILVTLFPSPFVANKVRIYPSGQHIALRAALMGTLMSNVDYVSTYMGCYTVFNTTSSAYVQQHTAIFSEDDCKTVCGITVPLFSYNAMTSVCSCHAKHDGMLPQNDCDDYVAYAAEVHRLYDVSCKPPDVVPGSVNETTFAHVPDVFTVSSTILFTCDTGHEFYLDNTPNRTITCGDDTLWHDVIWDDCRIISCPNFTFPNGMVSTLSITYNTEVVFTCDSGFITMSGSTQEAIKCQADKTWNSTIPVCQVIDCGTPAAVVNTVMTGNVHTYGANITYTCVSGMRFTSDTYSLNSQCGPDGEWETITLACTPYMCSDPPSAKQSTIDRINTAIVTYTCASHHLFPDGSAVKNSTCNDSFIWETIPDCIYDDSRVTQKGASILFMGTKLRQTTPSLVAVVQSDSTIDCGNHCLSNARCEAFNYNNALTDANCKLFSKLEPGDDFVSAVDWSYFDIYDIKYLP